MWIMNDQKDLDKFEQLHIDVARNATDDFNLFHDSKKWQLIKHNPFNGPIALGFQLEGLIENKVLFYRELYNENQLVKKYNLRFSNYQFSFVNAVRAGESINVEIRSSRFTQSNSPRLSNRVIMKANGRLVLFGSKIESQSPIFLANSSFSFIKDMRYHSDRSFLRDTRFFLKRKFMNTSNAKNFLCGSLVDQAIYIDEVENKVNFSEIFPCSFISCALLEKASKEKHDFKRNPMVYASHKISVDRELLSVLKSNTALHILVKESEKDSNLFECYGLINNNEILFSALISLVPLELLVNSVKRAN